MSNIHEVSSRPCNISQGRELGYYIHYILYYIILYILLLVQLFFQGSSHKALLLLSVTVKQSFYVWTTFVF